MQITVHRSLLLAVASASIGLGGCGYDNPFSDNTAKRTARRLDRVAQQLEEYGSVSMSSPLLVPAAAKEGQAAPFAFVLDRKAGDFFADAQAHVQGAAARLSETQFAAGLSAQGRFDLAALAAAPLRDAQFAQDSQAYDRRQALLTQAAYAAYEADRAAIKPTATPEERAAAEATARKTLYESLAKLGPEARPDRPAATPDEALPKLDLDRAKAETGAISTNFKGINELLPKDLNPTLSDRAAVNIAAGDVASNGMFGVLGDPDKYAGLGGQKRLMFGVTMVSVEPGWRTQKDYVGEVAVTASFDFQPAKAELVHDAYLRAARYSSDAAGLKRLIKKVIGDDVANALDDEASKRAKANASANANDARPDFASVELTQQNRKLINDILATTNPSLLSGDVVSAHVGAGAFDAVAFAAGAVDDEIPRDVNADLIGVPLVAAVSPMSDVQTLDLADGTRRRAEFAIDLALALQAQGAGGQARAFMSFAKQLQTDVRTRSAIPVVTSYSNSGGVFGFRVGPSLRGLDTSGDGVKDGGNVVERQTFPALVLLAIDKDDLGIRVRKRLGKLELVEPTIRFVQSARWAPLTSGGHRLSEVDRIRYAIRVDNVDNGSLLDANARNEALYNLHALHKVVCEKTSALTRNSYVSLLAIVDASDHRADLRELRSGLLGQIAESETSSPPKLDEKLKGKLTAFLDAELRELEGLDDLSPDTAQLLRQRLRMLSFQAVGSGNVQSLPDDFIMAKAEPTTKPTLATLVPASLAYDPAKPTAQPLVITGKNLAKATVELDPAIGAASVSKDSTDTTLLLSYTTPAVAARFVVVKIKDPDGKLIGVAPLALTPAGTTAISVSRELTSNGGPTTRDVYSSPDGNATLLQELIKSTTPPPPAASEKKPADGEAKPHS